MRPKACTTCRQWKGRCDADATHPDPCARCKNLNRICIFDRGFKRTRQTQGRRPTRQEASLEPSPSQQQPPSSVERPVTIAVPLQRGCDLHSSDDAAAPSSTSPERCTSAKSIGNVHLSAAQVNDLFRIFSERCLPYLPMSMCLGPETLHRRCPLLFWTVCSAAAVGNLVPALQSEVSHLVAAVINTPSRSVEVVQSLLLLCMWPFPFKTTTENPSLLYSAVALQTGLQLGLHRPSYSREFSSRKEPPVGCDDIDNSTWLACYIVSQLQASRLGLPISVPVDFSFDAAAACARVSPDLIGLYRVARFTAQVDAALGADPSQTSGLLDSASRLNLIKLFLQQLNGLEFTVGRERSEMVDLAVRGARLQLLSFVMRDDMPGSAEVVALHNQAERNAIALVQDLTARNLSSAPHSTIWLLSFTAFSLIRIFWSPYAGEKELIQDQVQRAIHAFSTAVKVPGDYVQRLTRSVPESLVLQDSRKSAWIRSRMAASILFDSIRIRKEYFQDAICNIDLVDLDGINWDGVLEIPT